MDNTYLDSRLGGTVAVSVFTNVEKSLGILQHLNGKFTNKKMSDLPTTLSSQYTYCVYDTFQEWENLLFSAKQKIFQFEKWDILTINRLN